MIYYSLTTQSSLIDLLSAFNANSRFARGHYHSLLGAYGLGAHRFSTERARLVGALRLARGHYHSLLGAYGLGAHGFSTERARLAGGTSLRSWFQKKCLLPMEILIFFFIIPPLLKLEGGFFST